MVPLGSFGAAAIQHAMEAQHREMVDFVLWEVEMAPPSPEGR